MSVRTLVIFLTWLMTSPGWATSMSPYRCALHFETDPSAPSAIGSAFRLAPGGAVEICAPYDRRGSETYFIAAAPVLDDGVCRVTRRQMFRESGGTGWTYSPPPDHPQRADFRTFLMLFESVCPPQGDRRYIVSTDVSPRVFRAASAFLARILSEGSLAAVPWHESLKMYSDAFQSFAAELARGGNAGDFNLTWMSKQPGGWHRSEDAYEMEISSASARWLLIVDFSGPEPVLVGTATVQ